MSKKVKWLSRHADGRHFPVLQRRNLPQIKLPKAKKIILDLPIDKLVEREKRPVTIDDRTKYFVKMLISGMPLEPIWVKRNSRNRYIIFDGHARYRAAKLLGIKSMQAVIMTKKQARAMEKLRPISTARALQIVKEMHNPGVIQARYAAIGN
jgi:hypothetical protein